MRTSWSPPVVLLLLGVVLATLVPPSAAVAVPSAVVHQAPVPGAVLRGFEAPEHRYATGHRGVDLAVGVGEVVATSAGGRVTHAGAVAGQVWVTVAHPDGVRTSYGELTDLRVAAGDEVVAGQALGRAVGDHRSSSDHGAATPGRDPGMHWSARRGDDYLDPLTLLQRPRASLVGPGRWWGTAPSVVPYAPFEPGRWAAGTSQVASRPGYGVAPNHHHLVMVPGFTTSGPHDLFDPSFLGYADGDVSRFSYAGCDPTPSGCDAQPYVATDTHVEVVDAAAALAEHLRGRQRAHPWRPVDLLGHSMGGDVITTFLEVHYDPHDPTFPPLGEVVTFGTPHGGSGLAVFGQALSRSIPGTAAAEALLFAGRRMGVPGTDPGTLRAPAVERYGSRGGPTRDLERLEELGVDVHAFAGARDVVVGPRRAAPRRGEAGVLPGGHGEVHRTEAALQATRSVLGGEAPVVADGPLAGAPAQVADTGWRVLGLAVDVFDLGSKARLVRRGADGVRRFVTGEKRDDAGREVAEPGEAAVDPR